MYTVPTMQQLLEAGVHFGHQTRRGNPKMREYIYGARDGVHIINLEQSEAMLKEAAKFAEELGKEGKMLLFVGTKKQAQPIVKEFAEKVGAPYVNVKWLGGLLTNFDEIRKNIRKILDLKEKQQKREFEHYTKKERLLISRKIEKFEKEQGGIAHLDRIPDAIFIVDCHTEKTAVAESLRIGIPTIAIADTNCNPQLVTYPIPGNDDATKSIRIIIETIANAYAEGLKKTEKSKKEKEEVAKEEKVEAKAEEEISEDIRAAEEMIEKITAEESSRRGE